MQQQKGSADSLSRRMHLKFSRTRTELAMRFVCPALVQPKHASIKGTADNMRHTVPKKLTYLGCSFRTHNKRRWA